MAGRQARAWEHAQIKAFSKWTQSHLMKKGVQFEDMKTDLTDGGKLIQLLEVLSGDSLGKFRANAKMRLHKIENVGKALKFIADRGVKLASIGAEDIVDGNLKLTLGLIWTLILRFEIQDISVEEMSAKEALLFWCQKKTAPYDNVDVKNFTFSWQDGLAFCALIHAHRPDLIDYASLQKANKAENLETAFKVAEEQLDIPRFLDAEDMMDVKPDERSVMTYVAQYFHKFASSKKGEVAGRRISKLVALTQSNDELKNEYNERARAFVEWCSGKTGELRDLTFENTLEDAKAKVAEFEVYQKGEKPEKAADKLGLEASFANIAVKLRNAKRPAFVPDEGLHPDDLNAVWNDVLAAEKERAEALRAELARQEKLATLVSRFDLKEINLRKWAADKEAYFARVEDIPTTAAAQSQLNLLEGNAEQLTASQSRVAGLKDLGDEIVGLNYKDADAITQKVAGVEEKWGELQVACDEKRRVLQQALEMQSKMEELRLKFADLARLINRWYKDAIESVTEVGFGLTLEAVQAYKETLDSTVESLTSDAAGKLGEVEAVWNEMEEIGVKDNRYTALTLGDIKEQDAALQTQIGVYQDDYAKELEVQEAMEAKRMQFAEAANAFVEAVDAKRKELEGLQDGEPEDCIENVKAAFADGEELKAQLGGVEAIDQEAKEMNITGNPHTQYSMPVVRVKLRQLETYVTNLLSSLEGDVVMKQKRLELEADASARDAVEGMKIEFAGKTARLNAWFDDVAELCSDVIAVNSVDAVGELQSNYESSCEAGKEEYMGLFKELEDLNGRLAAEGVTDAGFEAVEARSQEVMQQMDARKVALEEAKATQEANEALRVEFAEKANAFAEWVSGEVSAAEEIGGDDLEQQLENVKEMQVAAQSGNEQVEALDALNGQLKEAGIRENPHTEHTAETLSVEYDQLKDLFTKRAALLENEILQKKMSGVSAEELAEFKDVFEMFDKDKSGDLTWYEFKAVVASLGEDLSDDEVKAIVGKYDKDGSETIGFDEFSQFMLERRTDQDSEEQLSQAFKDIAGDKDFVTVADLSSVLSPEEVQYLTSKMEPMEGVEVEGAYDYKKWTGAAFAR